MNRKEYHVSRFCRPEETIAGMDKNKWTVTMFRSLDKEVVDA
jgi:hypothetical protein